jgi:hypothetical protein
VGWGVLGFGEGVGMGSGLETPKTTLSDVMTYRRHLRPGHSLEARRYLINPILLRTLWRRDIYNVTFTTSTPE